MATVRAAAADVHANHERPHRYFGTLLSSQLFLILLFPLVERGLRPEVFGVLAITVFLVGFHLITESRRLRLVGGLLSAPAVLAAVLAFSGTAGSQPLAAAVFSILFVGFVTAVILWELLVTPRVTSETLYGAIVGYLFVGIVFGMVYMLLAGFAPGSLSFSGSPNKPLAWGDCVFFSFVTLTTIGYGDLVPAGDARALAMLEGLIGAMYSPLLIGRLLASYRPSTWSIHAPISPSGVTSATAADPVVDPRSTPRTPRERAHDALLAGTLRERSEDFVRESKGAGT